MQAFKTKLMKVWKKWVATGVMATMVVALVLPASGLAFAETNPNPNPNRVHFEGLTLEVPATATSGEVPVYIESDTAFASADMAFALEGDAKVTHMTLTESTKTATALGPIQKDGLQQLGFFGATNAYKGDVKVAVLKLNYTSKEPVRLVGKLASITVITPQNTVSKVEIGSQVTLTISRQKGTPTGPTDPNSQNPSSGSTNNTGSDDGAEFQESYVNIDDSNIPLGEIAVRFVDIDSTWANPYIRVLASLGIIKGTTATTFGPDYKITRADFTKLLMGILAVKGLSSPTFDDVKPTDYFYEAVQAASDLKIVTGEGRLFKPYQPIKRQDMMVIMYRALKYAGVKMDVKADLSVFTDSKSINAYAIDAVQSLIGLGLIQGSNGQLKPLDQLTRAEAAKVLFSVKRILDQQK